MTSGILKLDPAGGSTEDVEREFDLAYYRSLSTADRFRMIIERSILLRRVAVAGEASRTSPALTKRR